MKKIKRPLSFLLSLVMIVSVLYFSPTKVTADGENENIIDEITVYETGASSTAYIDWEYEGESGTVYCGNSAKSYGAIQLRSKKNNSGIVSTETKGFIRKITIIWGDTYNNDNKDVIVYGLQTPYDNASDLYDSGTRGTQLGYLSYNDAEYDADRDLYYNVMTVNDNYRYVGIRSSSGALYLDTVYFEWEPNSFKQQWVWEDDYSNARLTLTEGGEILFSGDADSVDSAVTKEPSYLEYGEKTYTARLEYDGVTYMNKVTESIPKLVFEGTVEYIDESGEPADSRPEQ